jgi:hypothetical protein
LAGSGDLVDSHGFAGGYQSVKRYVRKLRGATSPEARAVIQTQPGEKCQVDYGTGPMVRDSDSGKYRRTRLFVLTLGCSRNMAGFKVTTEGTIAHLSPGDEHKMKDEMADKACRPKHTIERLQRAP